MNNNFLKSLNADFIYNNEENISKPNYFNQSILGD